MAGAKIEATMLLCDSVQSVGGKLYILGGGWTRNTSTPPAMGIAVKLGLPEELAGKSLPMLARLVTAGGQQILDGDGDEIAFRGDLEFARRPGADSDLPLGGVFALNAQFRGLQLDPGDYAWELLIDETPVAREIFRVV